nr:immunoglobulin heavy chain junction region [Macaca mulatta]MOW27192.1 immunoglobulin heavy chain junction region [Macaca mulatta]
CARDRFLYCSSIYCSSEYFDFW